MVDNGCTDNTVNIARQYDFTRIVQDFGPLGSARQSGLCAASGKYVCFCDADQFADRMWLSELFKYREMVDAIIGTIKAFPEDSGFVANYVKSAYQLDDQYYAQRIKDCSITWFGTGNLMVKREVALKVGFDRTLPVSEDGDFSYRFLRNGYTIFYNTNAIIYHRVPSDVVSFFFRYLKYSSGLILVIRRHRSLDLIKAFLFEMCYPISPRLFERMQKAGFHPRLKCLLLGILKFTAYLLSLLNLRNIFTANRISFHV